MNYCLNPNCQKPQNPEGMNFCQSCGAKLLLKERYRAVKIIGQGGFGTTFLALDEDKPSQPPCVIKRFLAQKTSPNYAQQVAKLFAQEAVQLEKLGKNSQIPELLAYFRQENQHYLVQEFIEGDNLRDELTEEGAFKETQIRQLLNSLLPVLQFVHAYQVIHRDIKPENIIRRRGDGQLVLVDFGAAKFSSGMMVLKQGTVIGTPQYVAPEQAQGKAVFASDLYSLGVTCLQLLTELDVFDLFDSGENVWVWRDFLGTPVSEDLGKILDKMVEKDFKRRYQSPTEVLQALNPNLTFSFNALPSSPESLPVKPQGEINFLAPAKIDEKFGYQDTNGQIIINSQFDEARDFHEGLALVKMGEEYAYINPQGEIISSMFAGGRNFSEGLAAVKVPHKWLGLVPMGCKWGYVDVNGEVVISPQFEDAGNFIAGLGLVKVGGKYGYINITGKIVITPQFDEANYFCDGLARVRIGKKYSYIDTTGRLISQMFDGAGDFSQGLAAVKLEGKYGYIDATGKVVIPPQFEDARNFCEGLAGVKLNGKYGYIDTSKQMVIQPQFNDAKDFSEGLAPVKMPLQVWKFAVGLGIGAKWGYIDVTGQVMIAPQFNSADKFINGVAKIKLEKQEGYINTQGEFVK